jgi:hypothetical protein
VTKRVLDPLMCAYDFGCRFHQSPEKQHAGQALLTPE